MSLEKVKLQESFLNNSRKKLKDEPGIDVTLWQLSYSYITFIICYSNKEKLNETKFIETLNKEMEGDIFKSLIKLGFKSNFKIKHLSIEDEIRYVWECARDKTHPHGNVNIFASGGVDFGRDDVGSIWTRFGFGKWELHSWAE